MNEHEQKLAKKDENHVCEFYRNVHNINILTKLFSNE